MPQFARRVEQRFARILVDWLVGSVGPATAARPCAEAAADIEARLRPGDVILVSGRSRFSRLVCRLTRSSWSHVAIYLGPHAARDSNQTIVEADIEAGVRLIGLTDLADCAIQVVRASRLPETARDALAAYLLARVGRPYDLAHVVRLAQVLVVAPLPVLGRLGVRGLRRADPSRAICSTLVAHALSAAGVRADVQPLMAQSWLPAGLAATLADTAPAPVDADLDFIVPGDFARLPGFEPVYDGRIGLR